MNIKCYSATSVSLDQPGISIFNSAQYTCQISIFDVYLSSPIRFLAYPVENVLPGPAQEILESFTFSLVSQQVPNEELRQGVYNKE